MQLVVYPLNRRVSDRRWIDRAAEGSGSAESRGTGDQSGGAIAGRRARRAPRKSYATFFDRDPAGGLRERAAVTYTRLPAMACRGKVGVRLPVRGVGSGPVDQETAGSARPEESPRMVLQGDYQSFRRFHLRSQERAGIPDHRHVTLAQAEAGRAADRVVEVSTVPTAQAKWQLTGRGGSASVACARAGRSSSTVVAFTPRRGASSSNQWGRTASAVRADGIRRPQPPPDVHLGTTGRRTAQAREAERGNLFRFRPKPRPRRPNGRRRPLAGPSRPPARSSSRHRRRFRLSSSESSKRPRGEANRGAGRSHRPSTRGPKGISSPGSTGL